MIWWRHRNLHFVLLINPFTPKSDQVQISPAAFQVILHRTVWRTWLFIAYSDWKMIILPILTTPLIHFSLKGWENVLFELGSICSWQALWSAFVEVMKYRTVLSFLPKYQKSNVPRIVGKKNTFYLVFTVNSLSKRTLSKLDSKFGPLPAELHLYLCNGTLSKPDTSLNRTVALVPRVSALERVDCIAQSKEHQECSFSQLCRVYKLLWHVINPFTSELKKCILQTFQKAIVWVM